MPLCLQMLGSATLGSKEQQDLLKAKYPPLDHSFPFGVGPHMPHAVTQAGRFPPQEDTPAAPRQMPLSAVPSAAHPILGDPADPQKLAASWVTTQQFGDTAGLVSSFCLRGPAAVNPGQQASPHALHVIDENSNSWQCVLRCDAFTWVRALVSAA